MKQKLVIIGNGMAPGRMLEHLLEPAPDQYEVTIFNAEPRVNYDRIMLSPVLSGEKTYEEIVIHDDGWYIKNGVTLYKVYKIKSIDRAAKTVTSETGLVEKYDKLVIATGSVPFQAVNDGRIKALWVMATNPAVSMPDSNFVAQALNACPFVVLSDVTAGTETAKYAHVLLPAQGWGEKDGSVTNSERRISRQRKFAPTAGEVRADWPIVSDVARAMGFSGF